MNQNFDGNDMASCGENILSILKGLAAKQALVIIGEKDCSSAALTLCQKTETNWRIIWETVASIGQNGLGKTKEGDGKSPTGIFTLGTAFGSAPPPVGIRYPYQLLTREDYWIDDSRSAFYNQWVCYREGHPKDWESAERLWEQSCYRHAVVINYNVRCEPGLGSAIFLHVWEQEKSPTLGCTAVSEADLIRILLWLDPDRKPIILQGTSHDICAWPFENLKC